MNFPPSWNVGKLVSTYVRSLWHMTKRILWAVFILLLVFSFTPGANPWRFAVSGVVNQIENQVARGLIGHAYTTVREGGMLAPLAHIVISNVVAYEDRLESEIQFKYIELRNAEPSSAATSNDQK